VEGQTGKAFEIALLLKDGSVEHKLAQEEGDCLLADLQAMLPKEQVEALLKQGRLSADQANAAALAYALEHE